MMLIVAFIAVATWMGLVAWRAVSFRSRADSHRRHLSSGRSFKYDSSDLLDWHEKMQDEYEFAAWHPWLTPEPVPLPPY